MLLTASQKVPTFHSHVTQEVKVENEWKFGDL